MTPSPVAVTAGALMIATGALILILRGPGARSLATTALLALWGSATIAGAYQVRESDPATALADAHLSVWYSIPLPALTLALAPLLGERAKRPALQAATFAMAALTVVGLVAFALDPTSFVRDLFFDANGRTVISSGPWLYGLFLLAAIAQVALAIVAVRIVRSDAPPVERQRARWIALGIGIIPIHAAGYFLAYTAGWPARSVGDPGYWIRAIPTVLAGALAAAALLRIPSSSTRTADRAPLLIVGLAAAFGLVDGVVAFQVLTGITYTGYETNAIFARVAFAVLLSGAVLRYGLADAGASRRRVVARSVSVIVACLVVAGALALGIVILGRNGPAFFVAGLIAIVAPLGLRAPIATAGRRLGERLLLPPDDPRAIAERARTYAAALAAARGPDGAILPEGEALLAQMRSDLGISEQEHALLLSGVASREKDRYHTVQTLGHGSTAQVELAVDEVAGRRVVVKRFKGLRDPGAVLTEARSLAAVRHPRVIPFLEVDRRGDDVYLVLAYAEGGSARQLLDKDGPLEPARAVALTRDLLEGLDALHRAGLVHCDVKPENLLIGADGRGLLGDFGSARFAAPDLVDSTLTGAGAEGSLSTIAPEALRGAPPAPTRDVYAAGALLYRLLTGQHYVDLANATVFEARERITMDEPHLPDPRVPPALERVIRKALAKRPGDRYQSARAMLADLET